MEQLNLMDDKFKIKIHLIPEIKIIDLTIS